MGIRPINLILHSDVSLRIYDFYGVVFDNYPLYGYLGVFNDTVFKRPVSLACLEVKYVCNYFDYINKRIISLIKLLLMVLERINTFIVIMFLYVFIYL